ncbi:MAG: DUF2062 domain-containing protein [Cyanobacteriota bacterium]|nr:DUF2062 domain-containing protein [Cyanobacteriota bacterium]
MFQFRPHHTLLRQLRRALLWLWHQEGTPGQRARGLAAGVFCGCYPFFGLQILLGVGLASVIRGNHLLAAAGTWISNPFTYLPLYWFNFQLGCLLLGPGPVWPGLTALRSENMALLGWGFGGRLLLGSTLTGLVSAVVIGVAYWRWLHRTDGTALITQEPASPGKTIRSM